MVTAIAIPFVNFRDKIRLTKEWSSRAKVEVLNDEGLIYIECYGEGNDNE